MGVAAGGVGAMRGQRLYDRLSRQFWVLRLVYAVAFLGRGRWFRRRSIAALDLRPGDRVLEMGCGPGNGFAALRAEVGPEGRVVGVDSSAGMVARARARVRARGWENVEVVQADATRLGVGGGTVDAVYAAMSLSATGDPAAAVRAAASCLRDDGRLVVLDARPFPGLPWSVLNPIAVTVFVRLTGWEYETDVPAAIRECFGEVEVSGYNGGAIYIVNAAEPERGRLSERGG